VKYVSIISILLLLRGDFAGEKCWDPYIGIQLSVCQQTGPGPTCNDISDVHGLYYDTDAGPYRYYAGPVGVYGRGHCISVTGGVWWSNQSALTGSDGASHCG